MPLQAKISRGHKPRQGAVTLAAPSVHDTTPQFHSNTQRLTFAEILTAHPTIENEEGWVQHSANAPWAWNASWVPKGALGSGSDQPFLDLVLEPHISYHHISRGEPKLVDHCFSHDASEGQATGDHTGELRERQPWSAECAANSVPVKRIRNSRHDGSYDVTLYDGLEEFLTHRPATVPTGPLLQIDLTHGVRFMGRPIEGSWVAHNHFKWRDISTEITDKRWISGDFILEPDYVSGEALCFSLGGSCSRWRIERSRRVGGPGGIKYFSMHRKIHASPGSLRMLPHPPCNRQDFSTPLLNLKTHGPRRVLRTWDQIVLPKPLARLRTNIRREFLFARACFTKAVEKNVDTLSDEDFEEIRKVHRQAKTVTLHNPDYFEHAQGSMWLRKDDGLIHEVFESDGPIIPGRADPEGFRKDNKECTPWANQALFDKLSNGWQTPNVFPQNEHTVVFRPYTKALYKDIRRWVKDVIEGSDPQAVIRLFCLASQGDLISIPWVSALRSSIPKPGRIDEWRMIVNLSAELREWQVPGAPQKSLEESLPHFSQSLNERICAADEADVSKHNLEMTRGADVGHGLAVYHDWGIEMEILTFDAKSYFHCFAVYLRRAMEQGVLTPKGLALSVSMDMGGADCPANTGEASSFITESVSLQLQRILLSVEIITDNKLIQEMLAARSDRFGPNSRNARVILVMMYSDGKSKSDPFQPRSVCKLWSLARGASRFDRAGAAGMPRDYHKGGTRQRSCVRNDLEERKARLPHAPACATSAHTLLTPRVFPRKIPVCCSEHCTRTDTAWRITSDTTTDC